MGAFDDVRVRDLLFFDRLAELGSITATARELGIPKPTASRWLALLETRIGQTLVHRTTRHVALTDQGSAFLDRVRDVLAAVRQAELAVQSDEPTGTIRVSVPVPLGRLVGGPVIAGFRRRLPRVRLEVALQNQRVDLVRDRFDLAIRGGRLPDSELVARKLATVQMWLYASTNDRSTDLAALTIVGAPGDDAILKRRLPEVRSPAVVVDDRTAVAEAVVLGAGAGLLPGFLGEPARRRRELVRRGNAPVTTMPVHAVYLPTQRDDPRVRIVVDEIERELRRTVDPAPRS